MNKLVSVIIPTFGSDTNLIRAIDSVFNQTYKNVEVIVVDDNGADSLQQKENEILLKKYASVSNFKYVVHQNNRNGSVARNNGAKNSSGEYLCFLDDDDYFSDPLKIEKQVKAIEQNSECGGSFSSLHIYKNNKLAQVIEANGKGNTLIKFIKGNLSIGTAAPVIKKECFNSINGFDESFIRHQDWEFFARFIDRYKLIAVPDTFYNRCYKNKKRPSASVRKEYLDHYAQKMRQSIFSLSSKKLEKLMKDKYISLYLSSKREKDKAACSSIKKDAGFNICDYLKMVFKTLVYFVKKI